MKLEWTTTYTADFPEEDIECICDTMQKIGWNSVTAHNMIDDVVTGFEDIIYYNWNEDQTQKIMKEIKHRLGGVQLSMFDQLE